MAHLFVPVIDLGQRPLMPTTHWSDKTIVSGRALFMSLCAHLLKRFHPSWFGPRGEAISRRPVVILLWLMPAKSGVVSMS